MKSARGTESNEIYCREETFSIPSFAGMLQWKGESDNDPGIGAFGTINVTIEFVDPKNAALTGGYGDAYLRKLCERCYFYQRRMCAQHTKLTSKERYKYFRIVTVEGDIVSVPSNKLNRRMREAIMENNINKNGNYDKGHLIGARFGGPNCPFNMVAMAATVNRDIVSVNGTTIHSNGEYFDFEEAVAAYLKPGMGGSQCGVKRGVMRIGLSYRNDDIIPHGIYITAQSHPENPESWSLGQPIWNHGSGNFNNPMPTVMGNGL
jgi:hypothetical protein